MGRVNVKSVRDDMGISRKELAERLGVHERTIQRWELAECDPSPLATEKIRQVHKDHQQSKTHDDGSNAVVESLPEPLRGLLPSLR